MSEICANCGLDVAAFRVEANGEVYCRAFCAAACAEREHPGASDGARASVTAARARIVARVKGARA